MYALHLFHLNPYSTGFTLGNKRKWNQHKKTWNVHGQRENFAFGTQRNLYSTDWRWGFALGEFLIRVT